MKISGQFIAGLIGGIGLSLFSFEALKSEKHPVLYIGAFSLIVLAGILNRKFRRQP